MNPAFKSWVLSIGVILCGVAGNALLDKGIKAQGPQPPLLAFLFDPVALVGVVLLIGWMLFRMALLSISPMSAWLPLVAGIGYLLITVVGRFYLHEEVGREQYVGVSLIAVGVVLIGSSATKEMGQVDE